MRTATATRRGVALAVGLLVLTAAGGLAARRAAHAVPAPRPVPPPGTLQLAGVTTDALHFGGRLDRGAVQVGGDGRVHLELVARGTQRPGRALVRRPTDLVVVLDRSGSMGGDPLARAVASVRELVGQLGDGDRFALVAYSDGAEEVLPLAPATPAAREHWHSRIASISAGGGTNMSAGLDRAHRLLARTREAGRMARVVLLSDGHANQGDASAEGLTRRAGRAVTGEYVLSTVGVGQGFDERLMTRLADAGTGCFYYVPNVERLAGIFAGEFTSARETVASALEVRIDTPSGIEVLDAAGYPLERTPLRTSFRLGSLFSGQERRVWVTLRVPSSSAGTIPLGDVRLHYTAANGDHRSAVLGDLPAVAAVIDEGRFVAGLDADAVTDRYETDLVGRVTQLVADSVRRGDYSGARSELEQVDFTELRALGRSPEQTRAWREMQALLDEVEHAAAAPAAEQPARRNLLGKQLYQQGTDERRRGAKRPTPDVSRTQSP